MWTDVLSGRLGWKWIVLGLVVVGFLIVALFWMPLNDLISERALYAHLQELASGVEIKASPTQATVSKLTLPVQNSKLDSRELLKWDADVRQRIQSLALSKGLALSKESVFVGLPELDSDKNAPNAPFEEQPKIGYALPIRFLLSELVPWSPVVVRVVPFPNKK
jgi:hypothetical protein